MGGVWVRRTGRQDSWQTVINDQRPKLKLNSLEIEGLKDQRLINYNLMRIWNLY